jgi:perosamine synthetase
VFVDIDQDSLNLDPVAVEAAITPRTRALLIVHTFGRPADMAPLMELAKRHGLAVIEDACEAIGATYDGQPVGSFGDIAVFAFYPNKQITTGEGGTVVTRDAKLAETMRSLRNQGRRPTDAWLQHSELGFNYRLSEIACTLGLGQLRRLSEILGRRAQVADRYHRLLADMPHLILPALAVPRSSMSWFVFVVRLDSSFTAVDRDAIVACLHQSGVGCARYFAPIHQQPAYAEYRNVSLPVTTSVAARTLALPFFNRITEAEITEVVATLRAAMAQRAPAYTSHRE